jgi:hypothetical protein
LCLAGSGGRPEAEPLNEPGGVVGLAEGQERVAQGFQGVEALHPEQVLLQRADEALSTAVALGRSHEGGRALSPQEGQLSLEIMGHVAVAVILPDAQPARYVLCHGPEMAADALA